MESINLVCIVCPLGCRLTVTKEDGEYKIEGNKCPRGDKYAVKELTNPTRTITSTVKIKGGILNRLPVKTSDEIPKGMIKECMEEINNVEVTAPVKVGDVLIKNVLDTGVDIVASRSME